MDRIIALIGESGSGKSTIAELLEKEGYNYIQSYTTREPRFEGEAGHIFVDINFYNNMMAKELFQSNMIAHTCFDNEYYWATKEQYQAKGTSIYIIDVAGVKELREKVKDAEIVVIYLKVNEQERICRMCERGTEAVFDRVMHDREAFRVVPCNYVVDGNRPIEKVLEDVKIIMTSF